MPANKLFEKHLQEIIEIKQERLIFLQKKENVQHGTELDDLKEEIKKMRHQLTELHQNTYYKNKISKPIVPILFLSSNPKDEKPLNTSKEFSVIQKILLQSKWRENFPLHIKTSLTLPDLIGELSNIRPHIVHFSGHGSNTNGLYFENDNGSSIHIESDIISHIFEKLAHKIQCVLLNACYSESQAEDISRYIKYVIGMKKPVEDAASILFSQGFYQGLAAWLSIEESFALGISTLKSENFDSEIPVLIKKSY